MSGTTLVCPHCSHDGTKETSKSPLESYGFNYLADDVVCREVLGYDESGRLRLSSDFQCEGLRGINGRIECRSCWQTFPVPEGLVWTVAAEQPAASPEAAGAPSPAEVGAGTGIRAAADNITQGLTALLREAVEKLDGLRSGQIAALEARVAEISPLTEEVTRLREDVASLRAQAASISAMEQLAAPKVTALEAAQQALEESQPRLWEQMSSLAATCSDLQRKLAEQADAASRLGEQTEQQRQSSQSQLSSLLERMKDFSGEVARLAATCTQLAEGQEAFQKRLAAQANVIRTLHAAADEQAKRREELLAAARRLQEMAGVIEQAKPLPEEL